MSDPERKRPLSFKHTSVMIPLAVGAIALLGSLVKGNNNHAGAGGVVDIDESRIPAKAQVLDWRKWASLEKPQKQSENDGSVVSTFDFSLYPLDSPQVCADDSSSSPPVRPKRRSPSAHSTSTTPASWTSSAPIPPSPS